MQEAEVFRWQMSAEAFNRATPLYMNRVHSTVSFSLTGKRPYINLRLRSAPYCAPFYTWVVSNYSYFPVTDLNIICYSQRQLSEKIQKLLLVVSEKSLFIANFNQLIH